MLPSANIAACLIWIQTVQIMLQKINSSNNEILQTLVGKVSFDVALYFDSQANPHPLYFQILPYYKTPMGAQMREYVITKVSKSYYYAMY